MGLQGHPKGPYDPYFKKPCEHNKSSRIEVTLSVYGMMIGFMKTFDEFENGPSETPISALKTLTSKKLVNTITLQGIQ